jgi:2'-5' RNA ligase
MKIKKYIQFIKESTTHEYGCVMVEISVSNWNAITSIIDTDDIYEKDDDSTYGIQKNPHLTLFYGLHDTVTPEMVNSVFDKFDGDINIEVDGIDIFQNEEFDVVKFNVKADDDLQYLHDELSQFPNSNSFPDYKPHITLAYTKKGTGKKYIKPDYKYQVKNIDKITYSMPNGKIFKFDYKLNESIKIDGLEYDSEWKLPTSPLRTEIVSNLNDILLEITDLEYSVQINGFIAGGAGGSLRSPHIWICNKRGGKRCPIIWEQINDVVETILDYLKSEGFWTHKEIINEGRPLEQLYIHFDKSKITENLNESGRWISPYKI